MADDKTKILEHVNPARRDFLKTLLAGTTFAAPLIATFSIDSLSAQVVLNPGGCNLTVNTTCNTICGPDLGYVGPRTFEAHVTGGTFFRNNPNGEVTLTVHAVGQVVTSIHGSIRTVNGVIVQNVNILLGGSPVLKNVVITGNEFTITAANLDTTVVCDLDELCDEIAAGATCVSGKICVFPISGPTIQLGVTFQLNPITLAGALVPVFTGDNGNG